MTNTIDHVEIEHVNGKSQTAVRADIARNQEDLTIIKRTVSRSEPSGRANQVCVRINLIDGLHSLNEKSEIRLSGRIDLDLSAHPVIGASVMLEVDS